MGVVKRLAHAFNVFFNLERPEPYEQISSYGSTRPDRTRLRFTAEKTILASILTRIAIDVADLKIRHVKLDEQGRYDSEINSGLNQCLNVEANIDQAARHFRQDIAMTLFDEGVIALVPIETTIDPRKSGSFDVQTIRVGKIIKWSPEYVRVQVYNEKTMLKEEVTVPKRYTAIIENPLYSVMNEQNSTLQRLIRKLNLLDAVDEQSGSGNLDIIIQLPYTIKSEQKRQQAEQRMKDIEFQLKGSQYGIAYTEGTEKVIQLNRPTENNLLKQVEFLTELLYSQLGITKEVMAGTAAQPEMLNYYNRTIKPIMDAIVEAMRRSFLTKTARTQGHSILYFYDPFSLIPVTELAEIADKFTRNEIMSSNEMREVVGRPPVKDKNADQLRNSNMPDDKLGVNPPQKPPLKLAEPAVPS
jgi:hypothetical protein